MSIQNNILFNFRKLMILFSMPSITLLIFILKGFDNKTDQIFDIDVSVYLIIVCTIINLIPLLPFLPNTADDNLDMNTVTIESQGMSFLGLYLSIWFVALSISGMYVLIAILIFILVMQMFLNFNYYSISLLFLGYRYYKITDNKNSYVLISNDSDIKQRKTTKQLYRINNFTFLYTI